MSRAKKRLTRALEAKGYNVVEVYYDDPSEGGWKCCLADPDDHTYQFHDWLGINLNAALERIETMEPWPQDDDITHTLSTRTSE